jgi:hypothetical protein
MKIEIRNYVERTDFEMISRWLSLWNQPVGNKDFYPKTTYVATVDGVPVLTGCLYLTNCKNAAMMENIIGDPNKPKERKAALSKLFDHIAKEAKRLGYKYIVSMVLEPKLIANYEKHGFAVTARNYTSVSKKL